MTSWVIIHLIPSLRKLSQRRGSPGKDGEIAISYSPLLLLKRMKNLINSLRLVIPTHTDRLLLLLLHQRQVSSWLEYKFLLMRRRSLLQTETTASLTDASAEMNHRQKRYSSHSKMCGGEKESNGVNDEMMIDFSLWFLFFPFLFF